MITQRNEEIHFREAERRSFALVGRPDREVICARILRLWARPAGSLCSPPRPELVAAP
jgi:hypothetical protein